MAKQRHASAVHAAQRLLLDLGIASPGEIDVVLVAAHLGLLVRPLPLRHEEGRLLRTRSHGIVNVAESAYASHKWRFVVAHEIGHFVRHAEHDAFEACTKGDLASYLAGGREAEANDFASELLMPAFLFDPRCRDAEPSLRDVGALARDFGASLSATALRYVQSAPRPCAVVCSTRGIVDWVDATPGFLPLVKRGDSLGGETGVATLLAEDRPSTHGPEQVAAREWGGEDGKVLEDSRRVAGDSVLTLLSLG